MNSNLKVLHVNDVANVASSLVEVANANGRAWRLHEIPHPSPEMPRWKTVAARVLDLVDFRRMRHSAEVLHIHYGPNGYYGFQSEIPFVLHIHGSDLRRDLHHPVLGAIERAALKRADAVLYSTPDLRSALQEIRPDAQYFPNPLPAEVLSYNPAIEPIPGRVFCNFRFDDTKGGRALIAEVGKLVSAGVEVYGLDWGIYAEDARQAGIILHPLMNLSDYLSELAKSQLVIGQHWLGSLGMSDLQTLAVARPLVAFSLDEQVPMAHSTIKTVAEEAQKLLDDPLACRELGERGRNWVIAHHDPRQLIQRLEVLYNGLLK